MSALLQTTLLVTRNTNRNKLNNFVMNVWYQLAFGACIGACFLQSLLSKPVTEGSVQKVEDSFKNLLIDITLIYIYPIDKQGSPHSVAIA